MTDQHRAKMARALAALNEAYEQLYGLMADPAFSEQQASWFDDRMSDVQQIGAAIEARMGSK